MMHKRIFFGEFDIWSAEMQYMHSYYSKLELWVGGFLHMHWFKTK